MEKPTKEMFYLLIGSFFGALMGLAVNLLYFDFYNPMSWFMFFVTLIVFSCLVRWIFGLMEKVK